MRLVLVEIGRLRSRRALAVLLLLGVVLTGLLTWSAVAGTRPPSAAELARAERVAEQERQQCLQAPESSLGPGATAADCSVDAPTAEWFLQRPRLDLRDEPAGSGEALAILLTAVAALAAATFAGADWASGSLGNQLLFQPRRVVMWLAKAVAVVVVTAAVAAVLLAAFYGVLAGVSTGRGITVTSATWRVVLAGAGRALALIAACALGSYSLAMLLRSTVGAVAALVGYVVVAEALVATLPVRRMTQWSVPNSVSAWLERGRSVFDDSLCRGAAGDCSATYVLGFGHAAAYLGGLLLLAVMASLLSFRRRDV